MAIKASTGLRNGLLNSTGLTAALDGGFINIYSGAPPADADAAATGTLLCVISEGGGGTGLHFDAPADGILPKDSTQVWSGTNLATGVAGYYRHVAPSDTGGLSVTQPRLQGAIGLAGYDMNLSGTSLTSGATQTMDFYTVSLPTF